MQQIEGGLVEKSREISEGMKKPYLPSLHLQRGKETSRLSKICVRKKIYVRNLNHISEKYK